MLDWSGFLINSHDPLRGHVLKHIRQNSLTSFRYSVAEQGIGAVCKERVTISMDEMMVSYVPVAVICTCTKLLFVMCGLVTASYQVPCI